MKRLFSIALALVMVFAMAATSSAAAELIFTTGGTSGTYYAFGSVLAQYITSNTDVPVTGNCRQRLRRQHRPD